MNIGGGAIITLIGKGTYVFRSTGAFDSTANSKVLLSAGADACDVFWVPGAATTLGAGSVFAGTVIDDSGITVGAGTVWQGRALSFGGTVTLDSDALTAMSCASAPSAYTGSNAPERGKSFSFPSPAKGDELTFVYRMEESGKAEIRVWNENGDLLETVKDELPAGPQKSKISLKGYAAGVYLYKIMLSYGSGRVEKQDVQKFVVLK
jgi:hypothetical protein